MTETSVWRQLSVKVLIMPHLFFCWEGVSNWKTIVFIYSKLFAEWLHTRSSVTGMNVLSVVGTVIHSWTPSKSPCRTEGLVPPAAGTAVGKTALHCQPPSGTASAEERFLPSGRVPSPGWSASSHWSMEGSEGLAPLLQFRHLQGFSHLQTVPKGCFPWEPIAAQLPALPSFALPLHGQWP